MQRHVFNVKELKLGLRLANSVPKPDHDIRSYCQIPDGWSLVLANTVGDLIPYKT